MSENGYDRSTGEWTGIANCKPAGEAPKCCQLLARHVGDIIMFIRRDDGLILEANQSAIESYGYGRDELLSLKIHDLRGPEGRSLTDSQMAGADAPGILFETEHLRKDGTKFPVEVSSQGLTIGGTRVLLSVIRDISGRKRTEKALEESEQRFRSVFEKAAVGMAVVDPEGHILQSNSAMQTMLGYSDDEFRRMRFVDFTHPDDIEMSLRTTHGIYSGERASNEFEKRYVSKDGREIWADISLAMVRDEAGRPNYHVAVIEDITNRKQVETEKERLLAELSTERARWQATVEEMLDPVTVCDAEGRATYMNRAYERLIEKPIAEGLPMESHPDYYQIYRPDGTRFPAEELPLQKAARTGREVRDVELIQRSAAGREFTAIFSAAPLPDAEGRVTGAVAVGRDITEQRRVERALKNTLDELESRVQERTAELQRAYDRLKEETDERNRVEQQLLQSQKMQAIGTLASGVAHDFNNILAIIIGNSELALDDLKSKSGPRENVRQIFTASKRGRDLVKQILTFSRKTEGGKRPLKMVPLVKETFKMLRASVPNTVTMKLNIKARSPVVLADPSQIQQVLMNLVTNAVHAMDESGKLSITLSTSIFRSVPPDDPEVKPGRYVQLTVKDTGMGMTPGVQERVFEPFFTTKETGQGTGMGLAVVYGIVKSHGGFVTVDSKAGKGSTFNVFLPYQQAPGVEYQGGTATAPSGKEHILFVDDELPLVTMTRDMLERLGYDVTAATDSPRALRLFLDNPSRFDLVITDQVMPEMTGMSLAEQILKVRPDVPILLCTGYSETVSAEQAKKAGIREFLMKPLVKAELAGTIRSVLDAGA